MCEQKQTQISEITLNQRSSSQTRGKIYKKPILTEQCSYQYSAEPRHASFYNKKTDYFPSMVGLPLLQTQWHILVPLLSITGFFLG